MERSFQPDELFAAIEDRLEAGGYLRIHSGRHVTPPTTEQAAEMLRRQPGKQGVLDYDGIPSNPNTLAKRESRARWSK